MVTQDKKPADPAGRKRESPIAPRHGATDEDDCRCKEASRKTPRQLLETMWRDLTFWKKE